MRRERMGLAAIVILAALPAACVASAPEKAPEASKPSAPATEPAAERATEVGDVAQLALKTLSDRLSVPMKDITIASITPIEWRDSSMGCAKPDRGYMQVIMPGHLAVLEHGGRGYNVHMAGKRAFVCEPTAGGKREKEVSLAPLVTILTKEQLQQLAQEDLARRLKVPVEEITAGKSKTVEWPDESLGCPNPNETYTTMRSKGHIFELRYRSRTYVYHTNLRRVLPCPPIEAQ